MNVASSTNHLDYVHDNIGTKTNIIITISNTDIF